MEVVLAIMEDTEDTPAVAFIQEDMVDMVILDSTAMEVVSAALVTNLVTRSLLNPTDF